MKRRLRPVLPDATKPELAAPAAAPSVATLDPSQVLAPAAEPPV